MKKYQKKLIGHDISLKPIHRLKSVKEKVIEYELLYVQVPKEIVKTFSEYLFKIRTLSDLDINHSLELNEKRV